MGGLFHLFTSTPVKPETCFPFYFIIFTIILFLTIGSSGMDPSDFQQQMMQTMQAMLVLQQQIANLAINPPNHASQHRGQLPRPFTGKPGCDPASWLRKMEVYFEFTNTAVNHQKIMIASANLEEYADVWWRQIQLEVDNHLRAALATWEDFSQSLIQQFVRINGEANARDRLNMLRQTGSAKTYAEEFERICLEIPNLSREDKLYRFIQGLRPAERLGT